MGLGLVVLFLILVLPNNFGALAPSAVLRFPLELPLILGLLSLAPRSVVPLLRALIVLMAGVLLFLKLADMGTHAAFARPFNPLLDFHLLISGWHLLSGTLGTFKALAAIAAGLSILAAVMLVLNWALAPIERLSSRPRRSLAAASLAVAAVGCIAATHERLTTAIPIDVQATSLAIDRARLFARSITDLTDFQRALAEDAVADVPVNGLFQRLKGKDVVVAFVESYGRSVLDNPRYSAATRRRLEAFEREIAASGFSARSAWLTSPTVGGQSWLAHGTLLSGLWVDNQQRYDRLMTSDRPTLNALFQEAGWRTVAIMPAITMAWPEAAYFGYDAVYASDDLGYRGEPFNWVTMPDQYTLSAFHRLELAPADRPSVMAEIALISSHAPWTPIPPLLSWAEIDNGSLFTPHARAGDPPAVVWSDPERVREQYAKAIDYALETLGSFVRTYGDEDLVLVILGDHQPAPIVTGPGASRDVPVHIIAADPSVFEAIEDWSWKAGMMPDAGAPVWPMDTFRNRFVSAFSLD